MAGACRFWPRPRRRRWIFATDDDSPHPAEPFDQKVSLAYRLSIDHIADLASKAGLTEVGRLRREPGENERFQHGRLLAHKPTEP
jgi:hypothetical protein